MLRRRNCIVVAQSPWRCAVLVFLASVLLSGLAPAGAEQDADATLLAYFEAWSHGDLDRLEELVAPDFRRHGGPDESCESREDLKRLIAQTRRIYKHVRITVEDHLSAGDQGAMRGSFYGVHAEVDRIVEFPLMSMVRFEEGRVAEEWVLGNNFLALVGLGFQLTPPGFEVIPKGAPSPAGTDSGEKQ